MLIFTQDAVFQVFCVFFCFIFAGMDRKTLIFVFVAVVAVIFVWYFSKQKKTTNSDASTDSGGDNATPSFNSLGATTAITPSTPTITGITYKSPSREKIKDPMYVETIKIGDYGYFINNPANSTMWIATNDGSRNLVTDSSYFYSLGIIETTNGKFSYSVIDGWLPIRSGGRR